MYAKERVGKLTLSIVFCLVECCSYGKGSLVTFDKR